jgi:hypothetical protein
MLPIAFVAVVLVSIIIKDFVLTPIVLIVTHLFS